MSRDIISRDTTLFRSLGVARLWQRWKTANADDLPVHSILLDVELLAQFMDKVSLGQRSVDGNPPDIITDKVAHDEGTYNARSVREDIVPDFCVRVHGIFLFAAARECTSSYEIPNARFKNQWVFLWVSKHAYVIS